MKIGVIADTHIPINAAGLPDQVVKAFKECDLIIHAGDTVDNSVLKDLSEIAEVKAVKGNMDPPSVSSELPEQLVIEVAGKTIGIVHGTGPGFKVPKYVESVFNEKLDIIIFGHSHMPYKEMKAGTLYFNPGSPTDTVFAPYRSFGIIEIDGDNINAEIIKIN